MRLNPLRDRRFTKRKQGILELLVVSVVKETQCPTPRCRVVNHFSHKTFILAEIEFIAYSDFSCRIDDDIPEPLFAVEFPEQEHLNLSPGLLFLAIKPRRKYFCVVEDKCVPLTEIIDDVLENLVLDFPAVLVEYHQAALVSPHRRFGRNLISREAEIEL